jgi:hypothetical protein
MVDATRNWLEQVRDIEKRTEQRVKRTGEQVFDAGLVVLFFEAVPFFEAPSPTSGESQTKRRSSAARRRSSARAG